MRFEITEVPAYRSPDGTIVAAAETFTAYGANNVLYATRDEASSSLLEAATQVIGNTTAEAVLHDDVVRYAILYLAEVIKAGAI